MFGTVSFNSFTAMVNPYVLLARAMCIKGSLRASSLVDDGDESSPRRTMLCHRNTWFLAPSANTIHTSARVHACRRILSLLAAESSVWSRNVPWIESAHVMITFHAAIHDCCITLFPDALTGNVCIDPFRIPPHAWIDFAKLDRSACVICNSFLEMLAKVAIIQENIWIVEPTVEMSFYRLYWLDDPNELLISSQDHECGICSWCIDLGLQAPRSKDFVVFLTNPSTQIDCFSDMITCIGNAIELTWSWAESQQGVRYPRHCLGVWQRELWLLL